MDLRQAQQALALALSAVYGDREAASIADWVMEHLTGLSKIERLTRAPEDLSRQALKQYHLYRDELLAYRPVQYVLGECWFAGLRLHVDENVLIPRPETEELVDWAVAGIYVAPTPAGALLDVGTGSGCIPIAIAKKFPHLALYACDISPGALSVAFANAARYHAGIRFYQLDFLDSSTWTELPPVQWVISNPPYIPLADKAAMPRYVVEAEPSQALFVPDADPLIFYRALAGFATQKLLPGGAIFVETHEDLAAEVAALLDASGLRDVMVRKDMQGKDRMIRATPFPGP